MPNKFKDLTKKYTLLKRAWSPQQNLFYGFLTYVLVGFLLLMIPFFGKIDAAAIDHLFQLPQFLQQV